MSDVQKELNKSNTRKNLWVAIAAMCFAALITGVMVIVMIKPLFMPESTMSENTNYYPNNTVTEDRDVIAAGHTFGEWSVKTAATCSAAGVETRKCNNCGATEDREVKALGHTYGEWSVKTAATCSAAGVETRKCNNCDATEDREVKATGHQYDGLYCKYCNTCRVMLCEIGKPYTDKDGLTVTLNSFTVTESEGYYSYSINYTIKNNVKDSKIMPGSFKLFFTDNTGEPENGFFNYLYYGEESNRSYTWKVLKTQNVLVLEYNAGETDDNGFFRDAPIYDTLHWETPNI